MKEFKIQMPNEYEIDKEKSTFENIVFKSIKKNNNITYEDICDTLFKGKTIFYNDEDLYI